MELDFAIVDEWQGLSEQEKQQHLFDKQKACWMPSLSAT